MSANPSPTAAELLTAPERALQLTPEEALHLLAKVEGLASVLRVAAVRPAAQPAKADQPVTVSLDEAACIAGVTTKQLLRCAVFRPAVVKLTGKLLVVNKSALLRILERRSCA